MASSCTLLAAIVRIAETFALIMLKCRCRCNLFDLHTVEGIRDTVIFNECNGLSGVPVNDRDVMASCEENVDFSYELV